MHKNRPPQRKRRGLNDLHGDRAIARGHTLPLAGKDDEDAIPGQLKASEGHVPWDDLPANQGDEHMFGKKGKSNGGGKGHSWHDDINSYGSNKGYSSHGGAKGGGKGYVSCYSKHPALKLPGTELLIYGGNCHTPSVRDADYYIQLDSGSAADIGLFPWEGRYNISYPIQDMSVPTKVDNFKSLLAWTQQVLSEGKKVHVGCIGGHGRTGTFLAALVSMYGEPDAITYVRKNYCDHAVESSQQIDWLNTNFGITKVKATKSYSANTGSYSDSSLKFPAGKKFPGEQVTAVSHEACLFGHAVK